MKRWILKDSIESPHIEGIHPNITGILYNRGICDKGEIEEFLAEMPLKTYDPFLLKGMNEAVDKIKYHISRGSKICIYGDYDVDGVTAVCLVFEFLQNLTNNLFWYVPNRQEEGYGINKSAIEKIKNSGADLIISVDCGITSYDEVTYAKELGMDIIVTDHHTPGDRILDCIVINPKQSGCEYPFKELCGCGVAYKLIQALQRTFGLKKKTLKKGLDLVVTATVADIVPLLDENRTLVKYGIKEINLRKRVGLDALISAVGLDGKSITSTDIAFVIGPHINAGGRVDTAESSLLLLMENDRQKAAELAEKLVINNNWRKTLQMEGIEKAKSFFKGENHSKLLIISGQDIHEGVAGIVAGKLKDEYYRPTLIVTENRENSILKGTGRSIEAIDLYDLLKTQEKFFLNFGGHKAACGFSIKNCDLDAFKSGLEREIESRLDDNPGLLDEILEIESMIELKDVDNDFGWMLEKLEPFGQQNNRPVFVIKNVYIDDMRFVGKEKEHSRFYIRDLMGNYLECIMFNSESRFRQINYHGNFFDFVGTFKMNYRGGTYNIQFIPIDFRRSK